MDIPIVLAIVGWIGFAVALYLYNVSRINLAREHNALSSFALALLLSDEFYRVHKGGLHDAFDPRTGNNLNDEDFTYGLMKGISYNALIAYRGEPPNKKTTPALLIALVKHRRKFGSFPKT